MFVEALCKSTIGFFVLQTVLQFIESIITKDTLESIMNDNTEFAFDKIPIDDNRSIPSEELDKFIRENFAWFLNLDQTRQISVILKLLRLGGGGLIFMIYKSVTILCAKRRARAREISFPFGKSMHSFKTLTRKLSQSSPLVVSIDTSSDDQLDYKSGFGELTYKKLSQLMRRATKLQEYQKSKGIFLEDDKLSRKAKLENAREVIDYLQIMPICLNRKIMSYVDEKSLPEFKKVGKYWGKMIEESVNEKSGRKAINAKINKITGASPEKKTGKNRGNAKGGAKKEDDDNEENRDDNFESFIGAERNDFLKKNNLSEVRNDLNSIDRHPCSPPA